MTMPPNPSNASLSMDSPCINICRLDPSNSFCKGCGRTRAEIAAWPRATEAEKLSIKAAAQKRLMT